MLSHRKLPLPAHYHVIVPGTCRWCGLAIGVTATGRASKATWHAGCVLEYKFIHHPSYTRRIIGRRDRFICATCGVFCKAAWDLDHIVPLIEAAHNPIFWEASNMQTLCRPCHKTKTSLEAKKRAATAAQRGTNDTR